MIRPLIITLAAVLLVAGCENRKPFPESRLQQPAGEFSFITPDGWFRTKLAGIDYIIVSTNYDAGIKPNIFIDSVRNASQRADTAAAIIEKNRTSGSGYELLRQQEFITADGLSGIKLSATRRNKEKLQLALFHYLIQDATRVIAITCTCAADVKTTYEPIFDVAIESLKTDKL